MVKVKSQFEGVTFSNFCAVCPDISNIKISPLRSLSRPKITRQAVGSIGRFTAGYTF